MKNLSRGLFRSLLFVVLVAGLQVGVFAVHCVGHQHPTTEQGHAAHTQERAHQHPDADAPMECCQQTLSLNHCQIQPVPPQAAHTITFESDFALSQALQLDPMMRMLFFTTLPAALSSLKNPNIPDIPPEFSSI